MREIQLTLCTIIVTLFVCCTNGSRNKNINTSYSIDDVVGDLETMCLTYQNKNIVFSLKERTNTLVNDYQLKFLGSLQLENTHYELLQKTILSGQEFDSQRASVSIVLFLNNKLYGEFTGLSNIYSVNVQSNTISIYNKETNYTTKFEITDTIPVQLFIPYTIKDSIPRGDILYLNYCCPVNFQTAQESFPKPFRIGLRGFFFKKQAP